MLPSLFIAHGSPMLAIEDNVYSQFIQKLGATFPRPRAIVLFSAHWISKMQKVSTLDAYSMIYDFGGFPDELYRIQYPAKSDANIAQEIIALLDRHDIPSQPEMQRGLDHGAWVILRLLYPDADVPVIAMSVNPWLAPDRQYAIGQALAELRLQDVLIIGSGGTVHNLGAIQFSEGVQVDAWALGFDQWLEERLMRWDLPTLFQYETLGPFASLAVPPGGSEHFIPLLYAMGAADDARVAKLLHRSYQFGNLSHSVWQFG